MVHDTMAPRVTIGLVLALLGAALSTPLGCAGDQEAGPIGQGGMGGMGGRSGASSCEANTDVFCAEEGRCVPVELRCDGKKDCSGGEDEARCSESCSARGGHWCSAGAQSPARCLSPEYLNDGVLDCADGSDEAADCFACGGEERCLPLIQVCDGAADCADASDEAVDNCRQNCAQRGGLYCDDSCVDWWSICDGSFDCGSGSDEAAESCGSEASSCASQGRFGCGDGSCVPLSEVCNHVEDCPAGQDESRTACQGSLSELPVFWCASGEAVLALVMCSGYDDCEDASDEEASLCSNPWLCGDGVLCPPEPQYPVSFCIAPSAICYFEQCWDGTGYENCDICGRGELLCGDTQQCFPARTRCDGESNCSNGFDEEDCPTDLGCNVEKGGYHCNNGQCLLPETRCDGTEQCSEGEDELDCDVYCGARGGVLCDGHCALACDGKQQCADGRDEENCQETCGKAPGSVQCHDGSCVLRVRVCDGIADCPRAEDEKECEKGCPTGEFYCDGLCIETEWLCDGFIDCQGSAIDERRCEECVICDGGCLAPAKLCDEVPDCNDGSDEAETRCGDNCAVPGSLPCGDGVCIVPALFCDGRADCEVAGADGVALDESKETCAEPCSASGGLYCAGRTCLPATVLCDGTADCPDGSDESSQQCAVDCSDDETACANASFCRLTLEDRVARCKERCQNWCDPLDLCMDAQRCDRSYDCPDFSDERGCRNLP